MFLLQNIRGKLSVFFSALLFGLIFSTATFAAGPKPLKPSTKDKCPVCGMFVAKFPDFAAQIQFRDGTSVFFDGVKDMLRFYRDLPRYAPGKKQKDISAVYVTDYYSLRSIDGRKAFFVSGSDVYGPMGKELVPFEKKPDAQEFQIDHKGKAIYSFGKIDDSVMKSLE